VDIDSRRFPRVKVLWPAVIEKPLKFTFGETKDISLSGAFIHCQNPLKSKEVFQLHFTDSPSSPHIKVTAEVVCSSISDPDDESEARGMGVRFVTISDENRKLMFNLISFIAQAYFLATFFEVYQVWLQGGW